MSDGIVKGWVTTTKQWQPMGELSRMVVRNKSVAYKVPVLLIPDDGTWERMERDHRAMEKLRKDGERVELMGADGAGAGDNLWEYQSRWWDFESVLSAAIDPTDAILGTNGGGE